MQSTFSLGALLALLLAELTQAYDQNLNVLNSNLQIQNPSKLFLSKDAPREMHNPLELFMAHNAALDLDHKVSLEINSTVLERSGQWFQVSWKGVLFPGYDDYIALYAENADVTATAPIKFKLAASASSTHTSSGTGTTAFRVINLRQPLRFAFIRGGLQLPRIAAWSDKIQVLHPNEPTQGHLSLGAAPNSVAVQWTTRDLPHGHPIVQWSTQSHPPSYEFSSSDGTSTTYTREDMCGPPASTIGWFDPGYLHYVLMANLVPNQRYYYRYGGLYDEGEEWSEEYSFIAPPMPGVNGDDAGETSVTVLAVADLGQVEIDGSMEVSQMGASLATTQALKWEVEHNNAQLLIHNGDVSYARGYSTQWDVYWDQLGSTVRSIPYMTSIGNHERDWPGSGDRFQASYDSGGECGVAYNLRTQMPTGADDQPWYSFDFGPIHFIQYSTEHPFHPGSTQHSFISQDLAAVDRSKTPWVIVGGHRPMYIDSVQWSPFVVNEDQTVAADLRDAFEELFLKYKVDATWHGHHHSYQRTCAVKYGKCTSAETEHGIVHLVIGHAGAGLSPNVQLIKPKIFERITLRHGYLRIEANSTHIMHQMIATDTGMVADEFWLVKEQEKKAAI